MSRKEHEDRRRAAVYDALTAIDAQYVEEAGAGLRAQPARRRVLPWLVPLGVAAAVALIVLGTRGTQPTAPSPADEMQFGTAVASSDAVDVAPRGEETQPAAEPGAVAVTTVASPEALAAAVDRVLLMRVTPGDPWVGAGIAAADGANVPSEVRLVDAEGYRAVLEVSGYAVIFADETPEGWVPAPEQGVLGVRGLSELVYPDGGFFEVTDLRELRELLGPIVDALEAEVPREVGDE